MEPEAYRIQGTQVKKKDCKIIKTKLSITVEIYSRKTGYS